MNQQLTVLQSSSILTKITQQKEPRNDYSSTHGKNLKTTSWTMYHFWPSGTTLFLNLTDMISWILFSSLFRLVFDSL